MESANSTDHGRVDNLQVLYFTYIYLFKFVINWYKYVGDFLKTWERA